MRIPLVAQVAPHEPASSGADAAQAEQWSAAQAAAVAAAEAIAATAAAEVAAEAAATAQAAVNVAFAAAVKAAAKADEVAARAALAATAAALEPLSPESGSDQSRGGRAGVTTTGDVLLPPRRPLALPAPRRWSTPRRLPRSPCVWPPSLLLQPQPPPTPPP